MPRGPSNIGSSGLLHSCAVIATLAACATGRRAPSQNDADRVSIVAVERGPQGTRLVAIDERGDRRFTLVQPPDDEAASSELVRDASPAASPDGRWLVFASTRGRPRDETSLWIAPLAPEARARRLTSGLAIDAHPVWTPDGTAVIFASTRDGGDFDLWRQRMVDGVPNGLPEQLTRGEHHEVMPSAARDGTIVYAAVRPLRVEGIDTEIDSRLEERAPDGRIQQLTAGPGDTSPALSPDGALIAFARPRVRADGSRDHELWIVPRGRLFASAEHVVDLPLTEESGPVWSHDGRFVFATSLYRGQDGRPLFSSVVHVDLREPVRRARMLHDRVGPIVRLAPAIASRTLDVAALRRDPEYLPQLARIMTAAITKAKTQQLLDPAP